MISGSPARWSGFFLSGDAVREHREHTIVNDLSRIQRPIYARPDPAECFDAELRRHIGAALCRHALGTPVCHPAWIRGGTWMQRRSTRLESTLKMLPAVMQSIESLLFHRCYRPGVTHARGKRHGPRRASWRLGCADQSTTALLLLQTSPCSPWPVCLGEHGRHAGNGQCTACNGAKAIASPQRSPAAQRASERLTPPFGLHHGQWRQESRATSSSPWFNRGLKNNPRVANGRLHPQAVAPSNTTWATALRQ